jgi:EAL and modified HD-GYP domain-containing signal transduction protein
MTGIFSLLETLIGLPMKDIAEQLRLSEDIQGALLRRSGALGSLLAVCEELEKGDFAAVEKLLADLPGITANDVTEAQLAAARWVGSLSEAAP